MGGGEGCVLCLYEFICSLRLLSHSVLWSVCVCSLIQYVCVCTGVTLVLSSVCDQRTATFHRRDDSCIRKS